MWRIGQDSLFTHGPRPQDRCGEGNFMRCLQCSLKEAERLGFYGTKLSGVFGNSAVYNRSWKAVGRTEPASEQA